MFFWFQTIICKIWDKILCAQIYWTIILFSVSWKGKKLGYVSTNILNIHSCRPQQCLHGVLFLARHNIMVQKYGSTFPQHKEKHWFLAIILFLRCYKNYITLYIWKELSVCMFRHHIAMLYDFMLCLMPLAL